MKKWCRVDLPKPIADKFKKYLSENEIYFEPSSAFDLIHFECLMTPEEKHEANLYLVILKEVESNRQRIKNKMERE